MTIDKIIDAIETTVNGIVSSNTFPSMHLAGSDKSSCGMDEDYYRKTKYQLESALEVGYNNLFITSDLPYRIMLSFPETYIDKSEYASKYGYTVMSYRVRVQIDLPYGFPDEYRNTPIWRKEFTICEREFDNNWKRIPFYEEYEYEEFLKDHGEEVEE